MTGITAQTKPRTSWSTAIGGQLIISLVVLLFFVRGFTTVLLYSLVPQLKTALALSYTGAMLIQFCFFLGYCFLSLPAAYVLVKIGYIRAIVLGLIVMIAGCLMVSPAAWFGLYAGFLIAFFVIAAGITLLQVASNPLIAVVGPPAHAHSRLTLAQAFNSLGTTIGPLVGAWVIFDSAKWVPSYFANAIHLVGTLAIQLPFIVVAGILAAVAWIFWSIRTYPVPNTDDVINVKVDSGFRLLSRQRFLFGTISIFTYVGAEVAVGSLIINYLMQRTVLSISAFEASRLLSLYWGGAMIGRFMGFATLRVVSPAIALSICGSAATMLAILSFSTTGTIAAVAIIGIGLFNSIMFPTIFALAIEDLGDKTPQGSGILCMAIVGGAIVPLITGIVADARGLTFALLVPAACYLWIATYGFYIERNALSSARTTR